MQRLKRFQIRFGIVAAVLCAVALAHAQDEPSAVGPVMKLLRSGKVPEARLPAIVEIVGTRGNEHDLAFLFSKAVATDWPVELRRSAFKLLVDSAHTRKVIPAGDLSAVAGIIAASEPVDAEVQRRAIEFAGAAKVKAASAALAGVLEKPGLKPEVMTAALDAYVAVSGRDALPVITKVLAGDASLAVRGRALASFAELDPKSAAKSAVSMFSELKPDDDAGVIVDAFLARKNGPPALAEAVEASPPKADVAKLALRHMYAVGRSDDLLVTALGKAAGIHDDPAPLTPELVAGVVAEVESTGDAVRGEEVFRRGDLSCMKCHAVSAGGGQVGPDLSAVGSISPLDYLVASVLNPDQAIKEAYITRVVATADGRVLQGLVVDRNTEKLVLKDATGTVHAIAMSDIDDEVEGKSLMPKGLVKFMTRQELVDLVKFLSQLGRPGEYAIRKTARFQRYRLLVRVPSSIGENVPNDEQFEAEISRSLDWVPFYARTNGMLPLAEAQRAAKSPIVFITGEFDVRTSGEVQLKISGANPTTIWLDDDSVSGPNAIMTPEPGRHRLTLRFDVRALPGDAAITMELVRPEGSKAEYQVLDGA